MAPDWERHRAIIIHLYINDSMKLDDVVSHMREKYKFDKSKSSYEIHLKKWGAKKNVRQEEWRNIRHQINVRPGQKSQVALCGILLSENKLRKETQRYNVIPTANDFRNGLSSPGLPTDTFVRIQSPPTTELDIIWPSTLPWFQFKNRVIPTLRCASSLLRAFFNDPNQHYGRINANSLYVAWKNPLELRQAVIHLSNTVPDDTIDRQQKAEALARNKFPPCLVTEMLKVVFFRLSNNMDVNVQDSRNQREHDEFVFQLSRAVSRSNPEMLSALFSGTDATTNAIKEAVYTCAIRDRNYEFVELILKSGVDPDLPVRVTRHSRWEFKRGLMKLEWLMECHTKTGMQEAAILHDTHLGEILLNAGASVDNGTELLTLAAVEARPWRNGDDVLDFAQLLIKHGAVVRPSVSQCPRKRIHETKSLLFALTIADNNCPLAEFFAENGAIADLSPDSEVASCTCGYYGGAWSSKPDIIEQLLQQIFLYPTQTSRETIKRLLITSCLAGDVAVASKLLMLDGIDLDLNNGWISGITPLIASAWNPDTSIAEMLLDLGADVGPKPQGKTLETSTLCPIHVAAYYGNSSLIRSLIARGADCKVRYIMLTKLEWVDWRLEKLTNMLRWEWLAPLDLSSPLQFALESNNSHTIALLLHHLNPLEGGLDYDSALISEFTSEELDWHRIALYDKTPLAAAIKAGSEKIVRLYFHSGETYASTALHWAIIDAIESKNDSMFKLILGYRALEQIDECEASCLVLAIARCRWDLVYLLLCKPFLAGTSQSTYDNFDALSGPKWLPEAHLNYFTVGILTPLSAAMLSGNIDIVEAMIKCGYVPQETDVATLMGEDILAAVRTAVWSKFPLQSMSFECHRTMLTFAIKSKDKIKIQELIGLFPSLDFYIFRYRDVGYTPITLAAALGYIELVRLFLDAGANSYFISEVPQEYPVKWGHLMMGKMALKGTALEKAVRPKSTAVEVAASQGHLNIVDFLLNQQDVDLPTRMQGATEALGLVAGLGNLKMVKLLIERGADINASAAHVYDCTPLESAAINGRLDTVQFLLEKGAQLGGSMQMHYVRSIYFATKLGHFAIADHLKRCGYWGTEDQSIYRHFEKFNSERSRYIIDVENNLWEWIEEFSGWSSVNPFVHTTYPVPSENASDTEYRHDNGVQERVIKGAKDSPKTNDVVQQTSRPISLETSHEPPTVSVGRNITGIADMETGREGPLTGVNGPDRSGDFSEVVPVIERTPDFGIEDIDADTQSLLLNYVDEGWEGPFTNID